MSLKTIQSTFAVSCLLLSGCNVKTTSDGDSIICTTEVAPAISVAIFDQYTAEPNSCGATVKIQSGDFIEEVTNEAGENCDQALTLSGAGERAGTYDISVTKNGYVDWYQYNVEVTSNICHVNTVSIQAFMESTTEDESDDINCLAFVKPAIELTVFDKETGEKNSCGVTMTLQDGDFIEEISNEAGGDCDESRTLTGALGLVGNYDIKVSKDGYTDWYQHDVLVSKNRCHVNTMSIQAYMEK